MTKPALSLGIGLVAGLFLAGFGLTRAQADTTTRPALSVSAIKPIEQDMPIRLTANGSVAAWQEAVIGSEVNDLRLADVHAQVGDVVRKGQVLAIFADDSVLADIAQSQAALAEAQANLQAAQQDAARAKQVGDSGVLSAQQLGQYLTNEKTALAKTASAKAQLANQQLRLKHTRVVASDDGIISSRTATLGAVAPIGQELFRLIRQQRLEWRAELTAAEMAQLRVGVKATVEVPNVGSVSGKVRQLAPTLDVQSRNGLVYVDLPDAAKQGLRAGMFAQGEFLLGDSAALTVPQDALSLREGFSYVFRIDATQDGQAAKASQIKVSLGRRLGDRFEVLSGINADDRLVASGAAFLTDGDLVRVVQP